VEENKHKNTTSWLRQILKWFFSAPNRVKPSPLPNRNEPCHFGSGKKYKKCHLQKDELMIASDPSAQIQARLADLQPGRISATHRGLENSKKTISDFVKLKKP
jgi:hypothetical protein